MILGQSFVALLTLALTVAATPVVVRDTPVSLSFAKHVNTTGTASILHRDQARAKHLKARAQALASGEFSEAAASIPVTNEAVSYIASVRPALALWCMRQANPMSRSALEALLPPVSYHTL